MLGIIHKISEITEVDTSMWIYSESQTGKDAADRDTCIGKRRAYNYIDRGNNVNTATDLFNAINEGGPSLKGISLYICKSENPLETNYKIENLEYLNAFKFHTIKHLGQSRNVIRVFEQYKIGRGKLIEVNPIQITKLPSLDVSAYAGAIVTDVNFWSLSGTEKVVVNPPAENIPANVESQQEPGVEGDNVINVDDDETQNPEHEQEEEIVQEDSVITDKKRLFVCPVEECEMSFVKYGNFKKHMIEEKHVIKPAKESTKIRTSRNYKSILEKVNEQRLFPETCEEGSTEFTETSSKPTELKEGFARIPLDKEK